MWRMLRLWCVCVCLGTAMPGWAAEYQVVDLGQLGGFPPETPLEAVGLRPEAISPDGTIVGWKAQPRDPLQWNIAYVRTPDGTQTALAGGTLIGGADVYHALGAADGMIVGQAGSGACFPGCGSAWRWTPQAGFHRLTGPWQEPSGREWSAATGVNAHGSVAGEISAGLLGSTQGVETLPVAWIADQGILLGLEGAALAINSTGVVVGHQEGHATLWTAFGPLRLDDFYTVSSVAQAINDHGTITGSLEHDDGTQQAFVFLPGTGLVPLPSPPGDVESEGLGVRGDGVVFGHSWNDTTSQLVRWQPENGMVTATPLATLVDAPGWTFDVLTGVNPQGALVGYGTLQGQTHGFLLQPIPTGLAAAQ